MTTVHTTLPRAALGLLAGAITGALLFAAAQATLGFTAYGSGDAAYLVLAVAALGFVMTAAALVVIGVPAWIGLHYAGFRRPRTGPLAGFVIGFAVTMAIVLHPMGLATLLAAASGEAPEAIPLVTSGSLGMPWSDAIFPAVMGGLVGALVGWVVRRVAYRSG
jgi:hypothetical protein